MKKVNEPQRMWAVALVGCDNPDLFTDAMYTSKQAAIAGHLVTQDEQVPARGEYLLVEVASVYHLDTVAKAVLRKVDINRLIAESESVRAGRTDDGTAAPSEET